VSGTCSSLADFYCLITMSVMDSAALRAVNSSPFSLLAAVPLAGPPARRRPLLTYSFISPSNPVRDARSKLSNAADSAHVASTIVRQSSGIVSAANIAAAAAAVVAGNAVGTASSAALMLVDYRRQPLHQLHWLPGAIYDQRQYLIWSSLHRRNLAVTEMAFDLQFDTTANKTALGTAHTTPRHIEVGTVSLPVQLQVHRPKFFLHCTVAGFPNFTFNFTSIDYWNMDNYDISSRKSSESLLNLANSSLVHCLHILQISLKSARNLLFILPTNRQTAVKTVPCHK